MNLLVPRLIIVSPYRVIRGGSWFNYGMFCRAAFRFNCRAVCRINFVGFRLVIRK